MYLANFIVTVVFLDAYCTCRDIDSRAKGEQTPSTFRVLSEPQIGRKTHEIFKKTGDNHSENM